MAAFSSSLLLDGHTCRRMTGAQAGFSGRFVQHLHSAQPFTGCVLRPQPQRRQREQRAVTLLVRAGMFDNLSQSLDKAWDIVRKDGKLTPENVKGPMREIRRALLEADVSLPTVRKFITGLEAKALGAKVVKGAKPEQQLIKIVNDELVALMGGSQAELNVPKDGPQIILMAGLQGVGKTTQCGKLANVLTKANKKVLMVATDVYRPAAIEQLHRLGERVGVPVYDLGKDASPVEVARKGVAKAIDGGFDAVIIDTAGRLQINEELMGELRDIKDAVQPSDTLLVVDAMTGQEAAGLVRSFNEAASLTGAILTKMDGDSRGGAALSVYAVSGKPIKYMGTGEGLDALEPFYPDRIASRVLGMGDVVSLVEKLQSGIEEEEAMRMGERMMANKFDFNDFRKQIGFMSKLGGLTGMVKMMPGMAAMSEKQLWGAEKGMKAWTAMVDAMSEEERSDPDLMAKSPTRRARIARDSGKTDKEVAEMIAAFAQMRTQMQLLLQGGVPGMGSGGMSQEEMLAATAAGAGPQRPGNRQARRALKRMR